MIEHLDRCEARAFLAEVRRILRPGGIVRVAAPDIARLVQDYLSTGDADSFIAATHMGLNRPADIMAWTKWVLVGPRHHLWMYDGDSLAKLLREAGFADIAIMPPGRTNIADPGDLDLKSGPRRASTQKRPSRYEERSASAARDAPRVYGSPDDSDGGATYDGGDGVDSATLRDSTLFGNQPDNCTPADSVTDRFF